MSIAVSAVIQAPKPLLALVAGMCVILLGVAILVATDAVANLSVPVKMLVAVICVIIVVTAYARTWLRAAKYIIHISANGQIRLVTQMINARVIGDDVVGAEMVHLLPSSTICSSLLLLHLQNERRQITIIIIFPGMVATESFSALLVACRWILLRHVDAVKSDIRR